jgi:hypothetical protein
VSSRSSEKGVLAGGDYRAAPYVVKRRGQFSRIPPVWHAFCSRPRTTRGVTVQRLRNEISVLLRKSARNIKKSREINRKLEAVMVNVDRALDGKVSVRRKPPK